MAIEAIILPTFGFQVEPPVLVNDSTLLQGCMPFAVNDAQNDPQFQALSHGAETWTPKVCRIMAYNGLLGYIYGFWAIILLTLGV